MDSSPGNRTLELARLSDNPLNKQNMINVIQESIDFFL
jgi:hypothetical protein